MDYLHAFRVDGKKTLRLKDIDAGNTGGIKSKSDIAKKMKKNLKRMAELQYLLYAENKRSMLIILQAMDAGGKDGTIRHVMGPLNPQSCHVICFKGPTQEELDHDFLWRIHPHTPRNGEIVIFNRSHYEDVLIVRVHDLVPKKRWSARYGHINAFEELLATANVTVLKFFLYISKDEQLKRFHARYKDPSKHWKLTLEDFSEREHWDDYIRAYEDVLNQTSTKTAPWFVIPANHKWFRNYAVSEIIRETLENLDMKYPEQKTDMAAFKPYFD